MKTSTVTPYFYYVFNMSLYCNDTIPSFIGKLWDHFDILATGQSDLHCKIKETLLIRDSKPALNENVGSEKLLLY